MPLNHGISISLDDMILTTRQAFSFGGSEAWYFLPLLCDVGLYKWGESTPRCFLICTECQLSATNRPCRSSLIILHSRHAKTLHVFELKCDDNSPKYSTKTKICHFQRKCLSGKALPTRLCLIFMFWHAATADLPLKKPDGLHEANKITLKINVLILKQKRQSKHESYWICHANSYKALLFFFKRLVHLKKATVAQ